MPRKKLEEAVDGIYLDPVPVTLGDELKIKYKGLLVNSGTNKIFLHAGYGNSWSREMDLPMKKTRDGGWSIAIPIEEPSSFNFCFRDDAQNWDNNQGKNWTYQVHAGDAQ